MQVANGYSPDVHVETLSADNIPVEVSKQVPGSCHEDIQPSSVLVASEPHCSVQCKRPNNSSRVLKIMHKCQFTDTCFRFHNNYGGKEINFLQ